MKLIEVVGVDVRRPLNGVVPFKVIDTVEAEAL
jgi:hypothetical protein